MKTIAVACPFGCGQTRDFEATCDGIAAATGLYLAHLIESHWPELVVLRTTLGVGREQHDAWTRL